MPKKKSHQGQRCPDFIHIQSLLSLGEIVLFEKFCTTQKVEHEPAIHYAKRDDSEEEPRRSKIAWLSTSDSSSTSSSSASSSGDPTSCPQWLFEKLLTAVRRGREAWPKVLPDMDGPFEDVQYASYEKGEHYKQWHLDGKPNDLRDGETEDFRALSVVVLLRPAEDGGVFETYAGTGMKAFEKKKVVTVPLLAGDAIVFPSQRLWHRVTAVEQGTRSSLVLWAQHIPKVHLEYLLALSINFERQQQRQFNFQVRHGKGKKKRVLVATNIGEDEDEDEDWLAIENKFLRGDGDLQDDYADSD